MKSKIINLGITLLINSRTAFLKNDVFNLVNQCSLGIWNKQHERTD
jgi:hypothetical protein